MKEIEFIETEKSKDRYNQLKLKLDKYREVLKEFVS